MHHKSAHPLSCIDDASCDDVALHDAACSSTALACQRRASCKTESQSNSRYQRGALNKVESIMQDQK